METFYELYDVKRMRIDDALKELSEKRFYLKVDYIYKLIFYTPKNKEYYEQLVDQAK
ncbi:MAG: hypothetical protein ACK5L5_04040 [Bacteroidales bacterium]